MLPKYALFGQSLTLFGGRISVLGGFLFGLSLFGGMAGWFVLSGEIEAVREMSWWSQFALTLVFSMAATRLIGHFLFRPLPHDTLPEGYAKQVDEGLLLAVLAGLRFREINGFAHGSLFHRRDREEG